MWHRHALRTLAGAIALVGIATSVVAAVDEDNWVGAGPLKGDKGYVTAPLGQLHYRDVGPRDSKQVLLLLHMTPLSMMQYTEAQNELASLGIRSIAVDTPGYGMSDAPSKSPTIPEYADNLVALLDHLKLDKVIVVGHHTGSTIGASFAVRHPDRVSAIVLHGVTIFNEAEIALRVNRPALRRPIKEDGSHLSSYFRPQQPGEKPHPKEWAKNQTWFTMLIYQMGPDFGHNAVYSHDSLGDFKALKTRGLILSDSADAMHEIDQRAAKIRPNFAFKEFSDDGTLSIMDYPKEWAKVIYDFAATTTKAER